MADRIPMMAPKVFWDVIEVSKHPDRDEFLQAANAPHRLVNREEVFLEHRLQRR